MKIYTLKMMNHYEDLSNGFGYYTDYISHNENLENLLKEYVMLKTVFPKQCFYISYKDDNRSIVIVLEYDKGKENINDKSIIDIYEKLKEYNLYKNYENEIKNANIEWLKTFEKANYHDVLENKLRVPKVKTKKNINMVVKEIEKIKKDIYFSIDKYIEYIEDWNQQKRAEAINKRKNEAIQMLIEKLIKWLNN